jgi:hypothetical protein
VPEISRTHNDEGVFPILTPNPLIDVHSFGVSLEGRVKIRNHNQGTHESFYIYKSEHKFKMRPTFYLGDVVIDNYTRPARANFQFTMKRVRDWIASVLVCREC